jgi:hypothetical protein
MAGDVSEARALLEDKVTKEEERLELEAPVVSWNGSESSDGSSDDEFGVDSSNSVLDGFCCSRSVGEGINFPQVSMA